MIRYRQDYSPLTLAQKGRVAFVFGRPVCPVCAQELTSASMNKQIVNDRFGLVTRKYYGRCDHCDCCYEVEQFKSSRGRWIIYRYRPFSNDIKPIAGKWIERRPLPVPLVAIGPGREYDRCDPKDFKKQYEC